MRSEIRDVPIVVLTGLDDDAVALEALRAGAQDYLIKGQIDGRLLARSVSYAMERKLLYEATERHLQQITVLKDINAALTSTLDLSVVLETLLEKIAALMPEVATTVRLRNKKSGQLEPAGCCNIDEQDWRAAAARWKIGGSVSDIAIALRGPLLIADLPNDPRARDSEFCRKHGFTAYLGLPLWVNDEAFGLIACYAKEPGVFGDEEIEFLAALAGQASVAIRNSKVHGHIQKLARDLERANHVKDEFLGVISHELRTPLNVTKGYVEMLQTGFFGELAADQQKALEKVANQTRVQLGMINNILIAIAMESDMATADCEAVSLRDFLKDLQIAYPQPLDRRITFYWNLAAEVPVVKTDKTKLQYILQNLINNAVKFTPEGSITVSVELIDAALVTNDDGAMDRGRKQLLFRVADTGVGIEEESFSVIFEKFSQVDSSTTRDHEGIGLGLHIVKRCTELLNGTVQVDSEIGKGTTFTVTIPCDLEGDQVIAMGGLADQLAPGANRY
jgi:signal transduction histidine kinase/CheY-like chemotaxis protein